MAELVQSLKTSYDFIFYDLCDDRTKDLFPSAWHLMIIIPFYAYFSMNLGPRIMQNLKPFKLKKTMFVYNVFQILVCFYILFLALKGGWMNGYSYVCQPVDMTDNPRSRAMLNAVWWYTLVKIIDLLDTVFFVLRKKERQISFLHLLHHSGMPAASFIVLKYYPNGHVTLVAVINCIIHIIMYAYYLISGLGPKYQKYLWWKKHLTTMQIVQFGIYFLHNLVALSNSACNYPKWISALMCIQSLHFMYLFSSFYYTNYVKKSEKAVFKNHVSETLSQKSKGQ